MPYDPIIHNRRSIRLQGYDYSQEGAYFITIVTQGRVCLFGEISAQQLRLNRAGEAILAWWTELPNKFPSVSLGAHVVMPNHVHGVIVIGGHDHPNSGQAEGQTHRFAPTVDGARPHATISEMMQWFKTMTTNAYIRGVKESGWPAFGGRLWQRNYYEHVVRGAQDRERIQSYIECNPVRWSEDQENPS